MIQATRLAAATWAVIGFVLGAGSPCIAAEELSPEAIRVAKNYVGSAESRLLIGLESDAEEVRKLHAEEPAVAGLIPLLTADQFMVRQSAALRLGLLGPPARVAIPQLLKALDDKSPDVGNAAVRSLCRLGPLPREQATVVIEQWRKIPAPNFEEPVPIYLLGPDAATAVLAAVPQADAAAKAKLVRSLKDFGPDALDAVSALTALLDEKDDQVVIAAVEALVAIGPDAIPPLAQGLAHPNEKVRNTVRLFGVTNFLSSEAAPFVPNLIAMLKDSNENNRIDAGTSLGDIGPEAGEAAVPALIEAAKEKSTYVRCAALFALGKIGPGAATAVPALLEALKNNDAIERRNAAQSLALIAPKDKAVIEAIRDTYKRANQFERADLLFALADIDLELVRSEAAVLDEVFQSNTGVETKMKAATLLFRLDPKNAERRELMTTVSQKGNTVLLQMEAAEALEQADGKFPLTVAELKEFLTAPLYVRNSDGEGFLALARIIRRLDPTQMPAVVEGLGFWLQGTSVDARYSALLAQFLGECGNVAGSASVLVAGLESPRPAVRIAVAKALKQIGEPAVPTLAAALRHQRAGVRYQAAQILGALGSTAKSAAGALQEAKNDSTSFVAKAAGDALAKVEGSP